MIRILVTSMAILLLALPTSGFAQNSGGVADGRAMIQAGRIELIDIELQLSDDEAAAFWPIFEQYEAEWIAVGDRYAAMLTGFVERSERGELDDDYAAKLLDAHFGIKQDLLNVQTKYLPKFMDAIPAMKVALFYQLENKIKAEVDAQLAAVLPLIEPI